MRSSLLALLASLLLVGCGSVRADQGPTPEPGHLTLVASPNHLAAGGTVYATVTLAGPADYEAGCVQTVQLWVLDSQRQRVWTEPSPEVACMALINKHLSTDQLATFHVDWPTARNLAPGHYTIHGLFMFTLPMGAATRVAENLPPADITLQ